MLKIAVTGNIASGKSLAESYLKAKGFAVYDTDKIAHNILANSIEVKSEFESFDILTEGQVDRQKLGKLVFSNTKLLKKLEEIIHPKVKFELEHIFQNAKSTIFVSVPQLYETGFDKLFDMVILVAADDDKRLERLMKRNNLSKEDAILRIKSQIPQEEKIKLADYVIYNNSSKKEFENQIEKILLNCKLL